jgi:hypothetical protein
MGRLRRVTQDTHGPDGAAHLLELRPLHELGRTHLRDVDDPLLSAVHAVVSWDGEHWWIRDCGSTNGTRVNTDLLDPRTRHRLRPGDVVTIGATHFVVDDIDPPGLRLTGIGHDAEIHLPFAECDALLPSSENPEASVWRTDDGTWMFENGRDAPWPLVPGSEVTLGGLASRAFPPQPLAPTSRATTTSRALSISRAELEIAVSPSEEEAEVTILVDGEAHRIPEKVSAYLLAVLARGRGAGENRDGRAPRASFGDADGWIHIDDVRRETGADEELLSVHVHRLRKRLRKLGFADAEQVIERRNRRLRLALTGARIRIVTRD